LALCLRSQNKIKERKTADMNHNVILLRKQIIKTQMPGVAPDLYTEFFLVPMRLRWHGYGRHLFPSEAKQQNQTA